MGVVRVFSQNVTQPGTIEFGGDVDGSRGVYVDLKRLGALDLSWRERFLTGNSFVETLHIRQDFLAGTPGVQFQLPVASHQVAVTFSTFIANFGMRCVFVDEPLVPQGRFVVRQSTTAVAASAVVNVLQVPVQYYGRVGTVVLSFGRAFHAALFVDVTDKVYSAIETLSSAALLGGSVVFRDIPMGRDFGVVLTNDDAVNAGTCEAVAWLEL